MSKRTQSIVTELESLSRYSGPWLTLRDQTALLSERMEEIHGREDNLGDVLIVALVGGSGVGKSTLLNALAGDQLAKTSEFRPCTSIPTVYHPPGTQLDFATDTHSVSGSTLENLVIVDTPDSDTIAKAHREAVIQVLKKCDLIMMCSDSEKYLDDATWSLLRPLQNERTIVCIETKASQVPSVREHWLGRLEKEGFTAAQYFRVNSLRTFDRKLSGADAGDDEYDFPKLESYLQHELDHDQIRSIKRSNAAGLLRKSVTTLYERLSSKSENLETLRGTLQRIDAELAEAGLNMVDQRLFSEPHLWNFALGKETSLRTKGVVGTLYKLVESVRTLPARMAHWSLWPIQASVGHRAATLLSKPEESDAGLRLESVELERVFRTKESELGVVLAKAGFDTSDLNRSYDAYLESLGDQIQGVLQGPARDRIVSRARLMSSWPLALALDVPPVAFFGVTAYRVVVDYFAGMFLDWGFFIHSGSVLGIILIAELVGISLFARVLAWTVRRASVSDLKVAIQGHRMAFRDERLALDEAEAVLGKLERLGESLNEI
ncbi:50S ribosome-binding GTPase [bacterium AH-315-P07]|nr:50S ribosome-binding GTPase [bacterium AH-315-P07]